MLGFQTADARAREGTWSRGMCGEDWWRTWQHSRETPQMRADGVVEREMGEPSEDEDCVRVLWGLITGFQCGQADPGCLSGSALRAHECFLLETKAFLWRVGLSANMPVARERRWIALLQTHLLRFGCQEPGISEGGYRRVGGEERSPLSWHPSRPMLSSQPESDNCRKEWRSSSWRHMEMTHESRSFTLPYRPWGQQL